jgi:hypothetical protein
VVGSLEVVTKTVVALPIAQLLAVLEREISIN